MPSCPTCSQHVAFPNENRTSKGDSTDADFQLYQCGNPRCKNPVFYGCNGDCKSQQKRPRKETCYKNLKSLRQHLTSFHKKRAWDSSTSIPNSDEPPLLDTTPIEENFPDAICYFETEEDDHGPVAMDDTPILEMPSRTMEFFRQTVMLFGCFSAVCRLVVISMYQTSQSVLAKTGNPDNVSKDISLLFINISRLVMMNGDNENQILSEILVSLVDIIREMDSHVPKDEKLKKKIQQTYNLPVTPQDFMSKIQRPTNTCSLRSTIPTPTVEHTTNTEHGTCSPLEAISTALLLPLSQNTNDHNHERYQSLLRSTSYLKNRKLVPEQYVCTPMTTQNRPSVLVYMTLWSDGWDPNRSNKGNRSPVWTATGTFLFVELGQTDTPFQVSTELLCAGPGKESHAGFFEYLREEKISRWQTESGSLRAIPMYSHIHGGVVNVFVSLGFFLQDNPERRGVSELLNGNSNTHGIFGVACDFDNLSVPFCACKSCSDRLLPYIVKADWEADPTDMHCEACLGWSLDKLCTIGRYKERLAVDVPLGENEHGYNLTVGPGRLTFASLKKAWSLSITKYIEEGVWNTSQVSSYLKLFCMNEALIKRFVSESRDYINIREALNPESEVFLRSPEVRDSIRQKHLSNPTLFHKPKYPAVWDLVEIEDITETPMHLAMGSQKAVLKTTISYCTGRSKMEKFTKRCSRILLQLKKLRVDLAPVLTFKDDKFGGFVAENYSAVTMVIPWFSAVLQEDDMIPTVQDDAQDPEAKPVSTWTGKECSAWLKQRGQKSNLKAAEAKAKVTSFLEGPTEEIPEIVRNTAKEIDPKCVRYLLLMANSLFSTLMAKDLSLSPAKNRSQAMVALFLNVYEDLDSNLLPDRKKPVWRAKYNMLGLLRVPDHFMNFTYFRNLYEGGNIGEGMVKQLRKLCSHGVKKGWSKNMIQNYYLRRSLSAICTFAYAGSPEDPSPTAPPPTSLSSGILSKFRRYKNVDEVRLQMQYSNPISIVIGMGNNIPKFVFGIVVQHTKHRWHLYQVTPREEDSRDDVHGFKYYNVSISDRPMLLRKRSLPRFPNYRFHSFGLMLPDHWMVGKPDDQFQRYSFVAEDWEHMKSSDVWTRLI